MKILFINPPDYGCLNSCFDVPHSLLAIASYVQEHGHDVTILDLNLPDTIIDVEGYDICGITILTPVWKSAKRVLSQIKSFFPEITIIAGGKHISAMPFVGLEAGFDACFVNEAEVSLVDWLNKDGKSKGIIIGQDTDLATVPPIDYSLINIQQYANRNICGESTISVMASRGCNYACAFCYHHGKIRVKPVNIVKAELEQLKRQWIYMADDNFLHPNVYPHFLNLLKNYRWGCLGRNEPLSRMATVQELYDSGLRYIYMGLESGSQEILKRMNKNLDLNTFRRACENCKKLGLEVKISVIVGFPGESHNTLDDTIAYLRTIPYDIIHVFSCIPYPGTDLWNNAQRFGITWLDYNTDSYRQLDKNNQFHFCYETQNLNLETLYSMLFYLRQTLGIQNQ